MPTPRDHLAAAIVSDQLVTTGGRLRSQYSENLDVTEVFDIRRQKWKTGAPLPTARSGIAAVALQGHVLVFGGESTAGTCSENEAYNVRANSWQSLAPMPTARHGLGATVVGDEVYVISGGPKPGGSFSDVNEVFHWPGTN